MQSSQAKGNDAEGVESCCESKGDAIQVRNVHKERSRIPARGCVCSTLSSPSLPPWVCPFSRSTKRDVRLEILCSLSLNRQCRAARTPPEPTRPPLFARPSVQPQTCISYVCVRFPGTLAAGFQPAVCGRAQHRAEKSALRHQSHPAPGRGHCHPPQTQQNSRHPHQGTHWGQQVSAQ